ncbi:iron-sulfur cluster assembly scaffold protein [Candidatus Pacearchaeota archaeon]|jgi:nitrogen fixation NifU-like protein|nr:iron-sulfur cluster assembly scaffold protein [Candidatus Pacearchaeota archaeon]
MTLDYSKEVMKNYMNPKNLGEIKNADGIGKVGNPTCGDIMWLYIKVEKKNGKEIIKDIKFKTFGCAAAIATSSMVTQLAKGKTLKDAEKIKYDEVMKSLGGLPRIKVHCSMMAQEALKIAIKDYRTRSSKSQTKAIQDYNNKKKN